MTGRRPRIAGASGASGELGDRAGRALAAADRGPSRGRAMPSRPSALPDSASRRRRRPTSHSLRSRAARSPTPRSAGVLPVRPGPAASPRREIFYVAYTLADARTRRAGPLTFLFNGGPGAASVFLHLGGIGPRRLAVNADGTWPPAPVGLTDNPLTWLAFTDLVFIDPVGTGYSRGAGAGTAGADDEDKGEQATIWGVARRISTASASSSGSI